MLSTSAVVSSGSEFRFPLFLFNDSFYFHTQALVVYPFSVAVESSHILEVSCDRNVESKILARIVKAASVFRKLGPIWSLSSIAPNVKLLLC